LDTLSHAIWGAAVFGYRAKLYERWRFLTALFFGAFPDLGSFGLMIVHGIITNQSMPRGKPPLDIIPSWVVQAYDFTHSFVVAFLFIGIVFMVRRSWVLPMLAWPLHICLDFPFHSLEYFPTKIIWPISDFVVDGVRWAQPAVWVPNIAGLLLVLFWRVKTRVREEPKVDVGTGV
jgi:hypothetical protein